MNALPPQTPPDNGAKPASDRVRVRRLHERGRYDAENVHAILDAGYVCHIGFVQDGQPMVIPTAYWREGDHLYIHGSSKSRMTMMLAEGIPACVTVTLLDALVLARSSFHHSMNYRSVVALGRFTRVDGEAAKLKALEYFVERIAKGRWSEIRGPDAQEMKATMVLSMPLDEASAKMRVGPPKDDEPDMGIPCWAGLVPFATGFQAPVPDPLLAPGTPLPGYLSNLPST
ncbi:MAG: pyridoxamine 5'-phosphate oxidase family protein [Ferrovibrio sp.]|nr:pyridoxamine 5'-phosphate oxidase family protein [Ferrovibrio sp.]